MALDRAALVRETVELYGLPAAEYTAARNARAKELRASDAELAAAVLKLPKPTATAAAANRLAREQPSEVRDLIQAGKRLRQAQEAALSGKAEPADLQSAVAPHRAALERVQREARRLHLSAAVLERTVQTIRAASLDPELQPLLERGILAEEAESSGFGVDPSLVPVAAARKPARQKPGEPDRRAKERVQAAEQALEDAEREAQSAEAALWRAEQAAREARTRAERALAALEEARSQAR